MNSKNGKKTLLWFEHASVTCFESTEIKKWKKRKKKEKNNPADQFDSGFDPANSKKKIQKKNMLSIRRRWKENGLKTFRIENGKKMKEEKRIKKRK